MKIGLKFIERHEHFNGNTTVVFERAEVDLTQFQWFAIVKKIPFMEEMMNKNANYYDGKLVIVGKGVSKCDMSEDKYDKKRGFYIAQTRAARDVMKKYVKFIAEVQNTIDEMFYNDMYCSLKSVNETCLKLQRHEWNLR